MMARWELYEVFFIHWTVLSSHIYFPFVYLYFINYPEGCHNRLIISFSPVYLFICLSHLESRLTLRNHISIIGLSLCLSVSPAWILNMSVSYGHMLFRTPLQCLKLRNACASNIPISALLECRISFHLKIAHLSKIAQAVGTKKNAQLCIISEVQAQSNNQLWYFIFIKCIHTFVKENTSFCFIYLNIGMWM